MSKSPVDHPLKTQRYRWANLVPKRAIEQPEPQIFPFPNPPTHHIVQDTAFAPPNPDAVSSSYTYSRSKPYSYTIQASSSDIPMLIPPSIKRQRETLVGVYAFAPTLHKDRNR